MLSLLPPLFAASTINVWHVFMTTDPVGQAVIGLLAVFSIFAWAVMLGKYSDLKKMRELNLLFERKLGEENHILNLPDTLKNRRDIPYADLLADALEAYWRAAAIGKEKAMTKCAPASNMPKTRFNAPWPASPYAMNRA